MNTVQMPAGTLVYHKTWAEFNPDENKSVFYTCHEPSYTPTDRDQTVIVYELSKPSIAVFDVSDPPNAPLKLSLFNSVVSQYESAVYADAHPYLIHVLDACGVDAIVSRMDFGTRNMEFITYPPVHPLSLLQYVRSFTL